MPEQALERPGYRPASDNDRAQGFTVPGRNARGRVVRLGPTLDAILSAHDYPEPVARQLAEALLLAALIGTTLRPDEGQMTLQAQAKGGPVDLLVCDYVGGDLRGYLRADPERIADLNNGSQLADIFGEGYLAITLDQTATDERYQGIVPLEGDTMCHAAENYFASSEQIPTLIRSAVRRDGDRWIAGGLLVQHLPTGEVGRERLFVQDNHPDWQHVAALAGSILPEELTDTDLALDDIVWRLFHEEEVRTTDPVPLARGCRCSTAYITQVLQRMSEDDRNHTRGEDGFAKVDCAFCSIDFRVAV